MQSTTKQFFQSDLCNVGCCGDTRKDRIVPNGFRSQSASGHVLTDIKIAPGRFLIIDSILPVSGNSQIVQD